MSVFDPDLHHRRSTRLRGFDYGSIGLYFITVCSHRRQLLFCEIVEGEVIPNELGWIVIAEWEMTSKRRPGIELDAWVLMPNHFHGIVVIRDGSDSDVLPAPAAFRSPRRTIGSLIGGFKSAVTKAANDAQCFNGATLWQRGFYDHIIRDDKDLDRIRTYIESNPGRWAEDSEYRVPRRSIP